MLLSMRIADLKLCPSNLISFFYFKHKINDKQNEKQDKKISHCQKKFQYPTGGRRGRDRMLVRFTTTNVISTYHH